jgi:hypothetical protein
MAVGQGRRAGRGTGHAGVGLVSGMATGSEGDIWLRLPRPRAAYRQASSTHHAAKALRDEGIVYPPGCVI